MNESFNPESMGLAHLFNQSSGIGLIPLILMVLMSVGTWYYLIVKVLAWWSERRASALFLDRFWQSRDLAQVARGLQQQPANDPYARLTVAGLQALEQLRQPRQETLLEIASADEFMVRSLRRAITRETLRLEAGLTFLASVGSAAPFVGLFGTVWGIYHALLAIGQSGQSTLDKVAGPVGEALIMTAFGLAVALPAVLTYNLFVRLNRVKLADFDGFAHDLYALLTTGHARRDSSHGEQASDAASAHWRARPEGV